MRKRFTEAVPGLKIDAELESVLADVYVESITHSAEAGELKIVVSSSGQIPAVVYSLEDIIRHQILRDAPISVHILQRFEEEHSASSVRSGSADQGNSAAGRQEANCQRERQQ